MKVNDFKEGTVAGETRILCKEITIEVLINRLNPCSFTTTIQYKIGELNKNNGITVKGKPFQYCLHICKLLASKYLLANNFCFLKFWFFKFKGSKCFGSLIY